MASTEWFLLCLQINAPNQDFSHEKGDALYTMELTVGFEKVRHSAHTSSLHTRSPPVAGNFAGGCCCAHGRITGQSHGNSWPKVSSCMHAVWLQCFEYTPCCTTLNLSYRFPRKTQPCLILRICVPQLSFRKLRELHAVTDEQDDAQAQDFVETRLTDQVNHVKIVSGRHQKDCCADFKHCCSGIQAFCQRCNAKSGTGWLRYREC